MPLAFQIGNFQWNSIKNKKFDKREEGTCWLILSDLKREGYKVLSAPEILPEAEFYSVSTTQ